MAPKLLLVIPPCFLDRELDFEVGFPVHLALLGREARAQGWDCDYLDLALEEKEGYNAFADLEDRLQDISLRVVGISNHTVRTSVTTRAVAERVKAIRPDVTVVVGGVNATFMYRELLKWCPAIDCVLRGYGQPGLRALLTVLLRGEEPLSAPGLVTRSRPQPDQLMPLTLADLATPSLSGLEVGRYLAWTSTYPLLTQTGCGFSCTFCTSVMPGPYQSREIYRTVGDVLSEIEQALGLGFRRFFMTANVFTSCRDYCLLLCKALAAAGLGKRISWACMTRVEFVDEELLRALRSAGCADIAFGVETAGADQWKSLHKGRYSEQVIYRAFCIARETGLATTAFLMLGAPDQTNNDVEATLELIRQLDPDHRVVSFFQPFPGTPYWEQPECFGLSEIAPLEAWNFYEAPICRTGHFDKPQLLRAAIRLHLERGLPLRPSVDALLPANNATDCNQGLLPPVRAALSLADGQTPIEEVLHCVAQEHGPRGRLLALIGLAARLRDRTMRIVTPTDRNPLEQGFALCGKECVED